MGDLRVDKGDPGPEASLTDVQVGWAKTGWNPHGIAISPDGTFAYVTNTWMPRPSDLQRSTVTRLDLRGWKEHVVGAGDTLWDIAAEQLDSGHRWPEIFEASWAIRQPDGRYLTKPDLIRPGWTLRVPISEGEAVAEVGVGDYPTSVVFTPDGAYAYVTNFYSNSVSCIRTSDNQVVKTIGGLGGNPWNLAISPAAPGEDVVNVGEWFLFVTHYAGGKVSRIDIPADPGTGTHTVTTLSQLGCLQWAVPWGVAIHAEAAGGAGRMLAYVTDYASRTVTCIDTADNTLADTFDLPGRQAMAVTVSPDGRFLFVTLREGGQVVRIDVTDRTRTVTEVGQDPWALALSPDGTVLYVTVGGASEVALLAASQPELQKFAHVAVGQNPMGVAVGPNDDYALVVDTGSHWISKLRGAPTVLVTTFVPDGKPSGSPAADLETHPHGVAIRPTGPCDTVQAWVTSSSDDTVAVIQAAPRGGVTRDTVRPRITVGSQPWGVAFRPDGKLACTTNSGSGDVSVISTSSYTQTRRLAVGAQPRGLAFHPTGAWAYVVLGGENRVVCLDPNVAIGIPWVTASIDVEDDPWDVAISPQGTFAYVTNQGSATISVIDTATHQVIKTIHVGSQPMGVTFPRLPLAQIALVAVAGEGAVKRIDTATHTVTGSLPVGGQPRDVTLSSDGRFGYVTVGGSEECIKHIHTVTNTVATTMPLPGGGSNPMQVAVSPGGTFAYASIHDGSIDPITGGRRGSVVRVGIPVTINVGAQAWDAAITQDGARVYVTLPAVDKVAAVDIVRGSTIDHYDVAPHPWHIAVTPDGARAYVTHGTDLDDNCVINSDLVSRITLPDGPAREPTISTHEMSAVEIVPRFEPGCFPWGIAVEADSVEADSVFVTMRYQQPHLKKGEIVEFAVTADALTPLNRCSVAAKAGGVIVDPRPDQPYLHVGLEQRETDITEDDWNHASLLSINRIGGWTTPVYTPLEGVPFAFDFCNDREAPSDFAYVVCHRPKPQLEMTLVRLNTNIPPPYAASATSELPSEAYGLAIFPDGRHAYLTLKGDPPGVSEPDPGDVLMLNTTDDSVAAIVHTSHGPKGVTIAADGGFAVVTNRYATRIRVI